MSSRALRRLESPATKLAVLTLEDRCVPASAVVLNDADTGPGSLRDAIDAVNLSTDATNQISFSNYFASAKTIALGSVLPGIAVPLTITGIQSGGQNTVTISGGNLVELFDTQPAPTGTKVEFQFLNFTKGFTVDPLRGGALSADDEDIYITDCNLTDNTAVNGGAVNLRGDQILQIRNSVVSGNSSTNLSDFKGGGALYVAGTYAHLNIDNCTLSGNTAQRSGGVANMYNGGNLNLTNSTVSGNSAGNRAAGFYSFNIGIQPKTFTVRNSTIAGNTSTGSGTALCVFYNTYGDINILNSTISGNTSNTPATGTAGGAISIQLGLAYGTEVNITSSVVSGNTHTAGDGNNDLAFDDFAVTLNVNNSAIGTNSGFTINGTNTGNLPFGADLKLGTLSSNGGTTQTMAITDPTSPLVNVGSNPAPVLAADQRGGGFTRSVGSFPDIGAFELQTAPVAPVVSGFIVNDNPSENTQRSRLTKVTVNFAAPVNAAQFQAAGAVKLTRIGIPTTNQGVIGTIVDNTNGLLIAPASGTVSSIVLTFGNISNAGVNSGSLADGRWQLSVVPAGNYLSPTTDNQLRRIFGDMDNNGNVDGNDLSFFPSFGAAFDSPFDFNNNGDIDSATDFAALGNRFGYTLN